MGLYQFPTTSEGVLPVLVMNTVLSVALLKNMVRSVLHVIGASSDLEDEEYYPVPPLTLSRNGKERNVSTTQFKSLCRKRSKVAKSSRGGGDGCPLVECCVCLCRFEGDEEVSELSCKHYFHKECLEKWFGKKQSTCPLCRSND